MSYQFKPSRINTLITIILLPIFISLGFWQLHRAQEKTEILQRLQQQAKHAPSSIQQLPLNKSQWQYLPVSVKGYFENKHQFLLDNKVYQGRVGYEVITPVKIVGVKKLVLVNRGWIAASGNRQQLPIIKNIHSKVHVDGRIRIPLGKTLLLGEDDLSKQAWPKRIQQLDFIKIQAALGQATYHFIVRLSPESPYGFVRQWRFTSMKPAKHVGYAIQWFAFAGLLLVLYVVLNLLNLDRENKQNGKRTMQP